MSGPTDNAVQPPEEFFPLKGHWPLKDSVLTVLRYELIREVSAGREVLELGCGAGDGAAILGRRAARYVGIDHKPHWRERCVDPPEHVTFIEADARRLPTAWTDRFDLVVALEIVEHVGDGGALLREITRVMRKGGTAFVSTPNSDLHSKDAADSGEPLFGYHVREYDAESFSSLLATSGLPSRVFAVSQLGPVDGDGRVVCACGGKFFTCRTGNDPGDFEIESTRKLRRPLDVRWSQGFVGVLGQWGPKAPGPRASGRAGIPPEVVSLKSVEWILMRRNEHLRELLGALANREKHVSELLEVLSARENDIRLLREGLDIDGRPQSRVNAASPETARDR
jgi:SAM-dependent methyltransferase